MALSDGDVIEMTLQQTYLFQTVLNVFHFRVTEDVTPVTTTLTAFYALWQTNVLPTLKAIISDQLSYNGAKLKHILGGTDEADVGHAAIPGLVSGDPMPPFVAWEFKYVRATTTTRHGFKRFAGISENHQTSGLINPAVVTAVNALAVKLGDIVWSGLAGDNVFTPVILSRFDGGVPRVPPITNDVNAVVYARITSQNTRKYGRGV